MNVDTPAESTSFVFDHERLDAYKLALEWLAVSEEFAKALPRGRGPLGDQLRRASSGIPLTIAEGVPRRGADRARFYVMAQGSVAECASVLDVIATCGLAKEDLIRRGRGLLCRLAKTLVGLERQARNRS